MKMSSFTTLKYPLRWLFQVLNLSLLICLIVYLFSQKIELENPYDIIIVLSFFIEIFSIIYLLRNKTYCYIGKDNKIYLIKRKNLTSDEQRETSEGVIIDHYRFNDKTIDVLNLLDIITALPSQKAIQNQIKNKVLTYSKYQVKKVILNFKFLGSYYYTVIFENGKRQKYIVFNNLNNKD